MQRVCMKVELSFQKGVLDAAEALSKRASSPALSVLGKSLLGVFPVVSGHKEQLPRRNFL